MTSIDPGHFSTSKNDRGRFSTGVIIRRYTGISKLRLGSRSDAIVVNTSSLSQAFCPAGLPQQTLDLDMYVASPVTASATGPSPGSHVTAYYR